MEGSMDTSLKQMLDNLHRDIRSLSERWDVSYKDLNNKLDSFKDDFNSFRVLEKNDQLINKAQQDERFIRRTEIDDIVKKNIDVHLVERRHKLHKGAELLKNIFLIIQALCPYAIILLIYNLLKT
jgi:hypothetical protein